MKKLVSILLLCAMLLSTLSMGLVVSAEEEATVIGAVNPGADESTFRTELDEDYVLYRSTKGPDTAFWTNARSQGLTEIHITTAEQLYGWIKYREAQYKASTTAYDSFEGVTIYLEADVDLAGITWPNLNGSCFFKGTFDGQGHVISNWKMAPSSGGKSFFGVLTNNASVKNVSLVDGTVTINRGSSNEYDVAAVVANVKPGEGNTVTISNVYSNCSVVLHANHNATTTGNIAGLVSSASSGGTVILDNCKFEGTISDTANTKGRVMQSVGGLIGSVSGATTVEVKNCEVNADINVGGAGVGGIIGNTSSSATVTIENCVVNGSIQSNTNAAAGKSATVNIGGLIGKSSNSTLLKITNCLVDATVGCLNAETADIRVAGGLLGDSAVKALEISNCTVKGDVTATSRCSGVLAVPNGAGAITVTNCDIDVQLYAKSGLASGIYTNGNNQEGNVKITNCKVAGKIHASEANQDFYYACAGIFCRVYTTKSVDGTRKAINITIADCDVSMDIDAGDVVVGGVLGYLADSNASYQNISISNCNVTGKLSGAAPSGGIIGYAKKGSTATISDCTVSADLNFAASTKQSRSAVKDADGNVIADTYTYSDFPNGAGVFVGAIKNSSLSLSRNTFTGTANFSFNAAPIDEATPDFQPSGICYAGAVGFLMSGTKAYLNNNAVLGAMSFENLDTVTSAKEKHTAAMLVAGVALNEDGTSAANVFYGNNNTYDATKAEGTGVDVALTAAAAPLDTNVIGYQTKDNGDGTYDIRYVVGMNDIFDGAGVRANLRFVDGEVFDEKYITCYVDTVYASVQDSEGNSYAASDYLFDYLYTVVIKNVPEKFNVADKTLQVLLTTFGATETEEGEVIWTKGGYAVHGTELINTAAEDKEFKIENFAAELDAKYTAADAIKIDAATFDPAISEGTASTKAGKGECLEGSDYATGDLEIPTHYYMDGGKTGSYTELFRNLTYTFEVAETGWYDICIDMRMKAEGTKETNSRSAMMMIDWMGGADAYYLHFDIEGAGAVKNASAGSYMTGLSVYLEAGEHTITFACDSRMGGNFHLRNIYLAKVVEE
ncbi:MAG: hypothetical protein IJX28_04540 [Clostridia bacterium]|nr:hypothetical protein [Clostridia bacterium]